MLDKHNDSKIVLNLHSLRLNFPTDIERERGENKIEGAKYFSVFSIFRSCWKKTHIFILHVTPFIRLTKIIHLLLKYFMYMYMLLSRRRPISPLKFIFLFFLRLKVCYSNSRWQPVFCFTNHHRWNHHWHAADTAGHC